MIYKKFSIITSILLLTILMIQLSSAADSSLIFKQATISDIKVACLDPNNLFCDSSVNCNITINYPNGNNLISNGIMTFNPSYFNYTLSSSQTMINGIYSAAVSCNTIDSGYSTFTFKITPTGDDRAFSLLLIIAFAAIIIFIGGLFTKNAYLGFISGVLFALLGVYALIYGFNNLTDLYTRTIGYTGIGLGILIMIISAFELVHEDREGDD